jgi:hypothetical protein
VGDFIQTRANPTVHFENKGRLPWGIDSRREIRAGAPEVEIKGGPTGLERAWWKKKKKRGNEERKKKKASVKGVYEEGHQRALLHTKSASLIDILPSTKWRPLAIWT